MASRLYRVSRCDELDVSSAQVQKQVDHRKVVSETEAKLVKHHTEVSDLSLQVNALQLEVEALRV